MVPDHRYEGDVGGELGFEQIDRVGQKAGVGGGVGGVALDKVTDLEDVARVFAYESACALHQAFASTFPHLPVAFELLAVDCFSFRIRFGISSVVHFRVKGIVMRVAKYHDGVIVCASAANGYQSSQ